MKHTDPEHCADMIRRGYGCVCGVEDALKAFEPMREALRNLLAWCETGRPASTFKEAMPAAEAALKLADEVEQ